jgi:hypothetical protein
MPDPDGDGAVDRITQAIADSITAGDLGEDTNGMPNQWVLVSTYYDSEGELCTTLLANQGGTGTRDTWPARPRHHGVAGRGTPMGTRRLTNPPASDQRSTIG